MGLTELYMIKGEVVTKIEILQNQLQQVNQEIVKELQKPKTIESNEQSTK